MRIWDIVDKTVPGVEITQENARPATLPFSSKKFTLCLALGLAFVSGTAFSLPLAPIAESNATSTVNVPAPPLDEFFSSQQGFSEQEETALLSKLDNASIPRWEPSPEDVLRAIAANIDEVPGQHSTSDVLRLLKHRKLA